MALEFVALAKVYNLGIDCLVFTLTQTISVIVVQQ